MLTSSLVSSTLWLPLLQRHDAAHGCRTPVVDAAVPLVYAQRTRTEVLTCLRHMGMHMLGPPACPRCSRACAPRPCPHTECIRRSRPSIDLSYTDGISRRGADGARLTAVAALVSTSSAGGLDGPPWVLLPFSIAASVQKPDRIGVQFGDGARLVAVLLPASLHTP